MLLVFLSAAAAEERVALADRYAEDVERISAAAHASEIAYSRLQSLCDDIGCRISGSPELEHAIDWAAALMGEDGLDVVTEPVEVPKWVRGEESARVTLPVERNLHVLGLGMTVAGDLEAPLVAVSSWDELAALDDAAIAGKIVLFDVPFTGYGETVQYRSKGPIEAGKRGAVAVLIRSVTSHSLQTPHTGATRYDPEVTPAIPAAALSVEDASWLHRLLDAGTDVKVHLKLSGDHQGMVESRNLLAEIPGRESPEEVVVVGCHIDSWDVGQGAQDDGAGCLIAWEAVRLLHELDLQPRRTIRAVLFTNEENGLGGGVAYAEAHKDEFHQALIESDTGNGIADGFRVHLTMEDDDVLLRAQGLLYELGAALAPIGGGTMVSGYSGADIGPTVRTGVPGLGMNHDSSTYWPIHHTEADTFDKIVLEDLQHNTALMAAAAWVLAEMPERLIEEPATGAPTRNGRRR
ncbi:MAG: M20/M25/M40 family metallo-hydrolase [Proteobacteria bacterium]|nr:M20/M25/M40 family metallo-hydrolase [Pseudomonadota bacterium]MCP4918569.1 M20/M25/M40 family metallo-hydrolase [Pseudomonadota bacterium]